MESTPSCEIVDVERIVQTKTGNSASDKALEMRAMVKGERVEKLMKLKRFFITADSKGWKHLGRGITVARCLLMRRRNKLIFRCEIFFLL